MNIVAVSCTLHTVYELEKQDFFEDWLQNIDKKLGGGHTIPTSCSFGLSEAIREELKSNVL